MIESIPDPSKTNEHSRKCGLTREQFAKGKGAFGDYYFGKTFIPRVQTKGLAEKHFIIDQKDDAKNEAAANILSKHRDYPNINPQINTVFVVEKTFTNEHSNSENKQLKKFCENYGCLLNYDNLKLYNEPDTTNFELSGFKGLPSVRTKTIREDPHIRSVNSFCIMKEFVQIYQCKRVKDQSLSPEDNKKKDFNCEKFKPKQNEGGVEVEVDVVCAGVIDDSEDSVGHLYGLFCKKK